MSKLEVIYQDLRVKKKEKTNIDVQDATQLFLRFSLLLSWHPFEKIASELCVLQHQVILCQSIGRCRLEPDTRRESFITSLMTSSTGQHNDKISKNLDGGTEGFGNTETKVVLRIPSKVLSKQVINIELNASIVFSPRHRL